MELRNEEEKELYKREHPELEDVMNILDEIDRNNIKTKEDSAHYWNALAIKKWMENNNTTRPPRSTQNQKNTITSEEIRLGRLLTNIRGELIKPYIDLKTEEEKEQYKINHPELEEVMEIVQEIDKKNLKNKEDSIHYLKALEIQEWMKKNNTTKPPRSNKSSKNISTEELKLGAYLIRIRNILIKPYMQMKTEEEKEKYKREHPELEDVMRIVEEIDKNNVKDKKDSRYYRDALKIKLWMEQKQTSNPPKTTGDREEYLLAIKLSEIRRKLIKPYNALESIEQKEQYKKEHPELEDVMQIVENIDREVAKNDNKSNNKLRINLNSPYYAYILEIKAWMENNRTTKPPRAKQYKRKREFCNR